MPKALSSIDHIMSLVADSLRPQESPKTRRIIIKHSDQLVFDKAKGENIHSFYGNVVFQHGRAIMKCDTAFLDRESQSFEAVGNILIEQGDSITIFADKLYYDGIRRIAKLRHNVVLENPTTRLMTDSLNYDRVTNIGYYFDGGTLIDQQNVLRSKEGDFNPETNDASFHQDVVLTNDSTELTTEHFYYNTESRIGKFRGNSLIKADSGLIISQRGVYDLNQDIGILLDRSELISGSRKLIGDSIYFNGNTKSGEAFGNMELLDTLQKSNLYGDYGFFDNNRHYAFATSRAYAMEYSNKDTLYVGADTLELLSIPTPDSTYLRYKDKGMDSLMRELRAYHQVRVFKGNVQAVADSMSYHSIDSTLRLYDKPIMWQNNDQLLGDTIVFKFQNRELDYVDVLGNSLSVQELRALPDYFNQMSGGNLRAFIRDSMMQRIDLAKPVENIFFMYNEKTQKYKGMNRMTSGDMTTIFSEEGTIKKTIFKEKPTGKIYPMHMAQAEEVNRLKNFHWEVERRPKKALDVVGKAFDLNIDKKDLLTHLSKISGAKAALKAYEAFERERQEAKQARDKALEELLQNGASKEISYTYILRNTEKEDDKPKDPRQILWLYNPFSDHDKAKSSNTNPYTLTPEKKNSKKESSISAQK